MTRKVGDNEMKTCEEYYEMLVFFDDLSHNEQQEVKQHTEKCPTCREHFSAFQQIKMSLKQREFAGHIDNELLTRYGIYLSEPGEPDYDGSRLGRKEMANIKKHVESCQACQQKVNRIAREYRAVEAHLEREGVPALHLGKTSLWPVIRRKALKLHESLLAFVKGAASLSRLQFYPIAATALAGIVILLWVSPLFRGSGYKYSQLASLELEKERRGFLTRSEASHLMSEGLYAFDHGRFEEAIEKFEQFVAQNPDDSSLFYAHYVAGLACLSRAKSDFLGRFQKYDAKLADSGIRHLQAAIQASNDLRIKEDAHWFIGKAYLMKQQADSAQAAFAKVQEVQGKRLQDAQKIIAAVEEIAVP
jgi:tetratricopeptide (TPR) repeat protein